MHCIHPQKYKQITISIIPSMPGYAAESEGLNQMLFFIYTRPE